MKITSFTCQTCGHMENRVSFPDSPPCQNPKKMCCKCCEKQGLQPRQCEMAFLELDRFLNDVQLSEDDVKGILLEQPLSRTLDALKISHDHNPFSNIYPNFQNKNPDILIQKLDVVIECKNLNKKQVDERLSKAWLDENIVKRDYLVNHRRKIALFSFKPKQSLVQYLNQYCWRVYSLETQILTNKQAWKAMGRLKQRFHWLKNEYKSQKSQSQFLDRIVKHG
jgi:hypothetical protein